MFEQWTFYGDIRISIGWGGRKKKRNETNKRFQVGNVRIISYFENGYGVCTAIRKVGTG